MERARYRILEKDDVGEVLFSVEEVPSKEAPGYTMLKRNDNGEVLYLGRDYSLVRNNEIVEAVNIPGLVLQDVRSYNDRIFDFNYVAPELKMDVGGLNAHFRVKIRNSYNGSNALSIQAGMVIQICSNGAIVSIHGRNGKRMHTGDTAAFLGFYAMHIEDEYKLAQSMVTKTDWEKTLTEREIEMTAEAILGENPKEKRIDSRNKLVLVQQYHNHNKVYPDNLAMFMAATYLATHGNDIGFPASQQLDMEERIRKVFF